MARWMVTKYFAELLQLEPEVTRFQAASEAAAQEHVRKMIADDVVWAQDCGEFEGDVVGSYQQTEPNGWLATFQFVGKPDQMDRYILEEDD